MNLRCDAAVSRPTDPSEYVLRVNLRRGADVRRFCEVRVKDGEVYIFQPKKGQSVKVSYHRSGQKHVKFGLGAPIMPPMLLEPTEAIVTEEEPWLKGFENFNDLLTYESQASDHVCEIECPPLPYVDTMTFAQVGIGRSFEPKEWAIDGVKHVTLKQEVFPIQTANGFQICVRVLRLQLV